MKRSYQSVIIFGFLILAIFVFMTMLVTPLMLLGLANFVLNPVFGLDVSQFGYWQAVICGFFLNMLFGFIRR